jgi:hypothetical protein
MGGGKVGQRSSVNCRLVEEARNVGNGAECGRYTNGKWIWLIDVVLVVVVVVVVVMVVKQQI